MRPVVFLKGDDISVYVNGELLSGVISLKVKKTITYYNICQYLSGEFLKKIPLKREYDLVLTKVYTKENPFENLSEFLISVNCDGKITTYEPCILLEEESVYLQNDTIASVYKIKACDKYSEEE